MDNRIPGGLSFKMPGSRRISGTTWEVYLYILTSERPQGVREIWRALNLSSPSLAQYHVNKLLDLGLIEATSEGKYRANESERMDVLRSFVLLRGRLIPRLVFYGALLLGIFLAYILFWPFRWDFRDLVVSLFSISAFFFEAYNQYRGLVGK
ncbi:transcriptional regulator [Candidatus Bathyarchaeota archaeon]|nr:MAG: transcriptional regulator [Candidatus Bathyarchaeota archaeon]